MEEMLVIVFDSETKAYKGAKALQDLQHEGCINLYSKAVIVKDVSGKISVKQQDKGRPVGMIVGLLAGSLFGLPGGAIGVTLAASAGTAGGLGYDLAHLRTNQNYLAEVEQSLQPGKAAVIAEVYGDWTAEADARVNSLGGLVFRCPLSEVLNAQIQRAAAVLQTDLTGMRAGLSESAMDAQARFQKRAAAARQSLQAEQDAIQAEIEESQKEAETKILTLQEQADKASGEQKVELERQIDILKSHQKRRNDLLTQAWELIKKALSI